MEPDEQLDSTTESLIETISTTTDTFDFDIDFEDDLEDNEWQIGPFSLVSLKRINKMIKKFVYFKICFNKSVQKHVAPDLDQEKSFACLKQRIKQSTTRTASSLNRFHLSHATHKSV